MQGRKVTLPEESAQDHGAGKRLPTKPGGGGAGLCSEVEVREVMRGSGPRPQLAAAGAWLGALSIEDRSIQSISAVVSWEGL